jgi:hypothetical protein
MPEMEYVNSSNVESIGYDAETSELHVRYLASPPTYVYQGVPQAVYDQLMIAPSKGSFIARQVKNVYLFYKL